MKFFSTLHAETSTPDDAENGFATESDFEYTVKSLVLIVSLLFCTEA